MPDNHYENTRLAALYDLDSPWSADRDFYLNLAGKPRMRILDIGCGTGLLCDAFANEGHDVTGVDPSGSMLAVAKMKRHGAQIEWVQSFAQSFKSEKRFDLIIMTGHAFQVLLDDAAILDTFKVMREHLNAGGLIVFESRNPNVDWASTWDYELDLEVNGVIVRESRCFSQMKGD